MKVEQIIKLLTICAGPNDEIMIQWWAKTDVAEDITKEIWAEAVKIWDNEPLTTEQAGVYDFISAAEKNINEQRRKELASKLKLITGG